MNSEYPRLGVNSQVNTHDQLDRFFNFHIMKVTLWRLLKLFKELVSHACRDYNTLHKLTGLGHVN